jgi:tetratricopeptide (TPR) repeat protein
MIKYDFNKLEEKAQNLLNAGLPHEAIKIYLFMADGDQSLDGGYLGKRIAECYESMNDLHAAKYWYGRAIEENPQVLVDCKEARRRLESVTIDSLLI